MQWAVKDNGKGTDHAGLEQVLQADIAAMQAGGGAMDIVGLECRGFEAVRYGMDGPARLNKGEECKLEANAQFAAKAWLPALVGYLMGIWFLQRGDPKCPRVVANSTEASALEEVSRALGAGEPSRDRPEPELSKDLEAQREALHTVLHLNLAAAALKLSQWVVARTACQYVLMVQGNAAPPKTRFRLAKALEGLEDYEEACSVLEKLLSLDRDNADAKTLLAEVQKKHARTKKVDYSSMGAEEWGKLSLEEQNRALEEINKQLDDEMGEEPDLDSSALAAVLGGKK